MSLDFDDGADVENANRGFVETLDPCIIKTSDGKTVWDLTPYSYLDAACPDTVNPSLWRQARLCVRSGLFEVTNGIYQIRGFDISNMTIVEGDRGVVIIDPMISAECAAAGLELYRNHRGHRPVSAVIYTHSHGDHFGGAEGVLPDGAGDIPIVAPKGFLEHAVSENVYAGVAMNRRGTYMYGASLDKSPTGQVSTGLGIAVSGGSLGLIPPTLDITHTGQRETLDGVNIVFQLTPGTEAPAEMNFHFPDHRALCMAENATHNLHNLLTLRGALIRDARVWSRYLNEAIQLFAADTDVAFASHHWPTWSTGNIVRFLSAQRDLYAYLHDQTLRMINSGMTGIEIAEDFQLPPALDSAWHARGYYGSVNHNVKAIYQRYMGWFDGHPTSLWQHPPQAAATRYVQVIGGQQAVIDKAKGFAENGDLRFAAELLKHAVFADHNDATAKAALADVYEQLGYGAENATWRGFYLTGAAELRGAPAQAAPVATGPGMMKALTIEQLFDSIGIRVDGPKAASEKLTIDWNFTDQNQRYRTTLSNGALVHWAVPNNSAADGEAGLTLTLTKAQLLGLLAGQGLEGIDHAGDPATLQRLLAVLDTPDPAFPIVTP